MNLGDEARSALARHAARVMEDERMSKVALACFCGVEIPAGAEVTKREQAHDLAVHVEHAERMNLPGFHGEDPF